MFRYPLILVMMALPTVSFLVGCSSQTDHHEDSHPATVTPIPESQLNTVVLSEKAEKSLRLGLGMIERKKIPRVRTYVGEVVLPAGSVLTVSAPVSGNLKNGDAKALPDPGTRVNKGMVLFTLVPQAITQAERVALLQAKLQLDQSRVIAEGQVEQAKTQVKAATISYNREVKFNKDGVGTKKAEEDALAQLELAKKTLESVVARLKLVNKMTIGTESEAVEPLPIRIPQSGIFRATHVVAGETVPLGTPLFEIMTTDTIWIKVPVYAGEVDEIEEDQPALIKNLSEDKGKTGIEAKSVQAPPTAQPQATAVDLYYELPNSTGTYRPGQRLSVTLPLRDSNNECLVVPWQAIVHDPQGGSWVYVKTEPRTFVRQRVAVKYVTNGLAVLEKGPPVGTPVVTAAAAELFGTEFGFGGH